MELAEQKCQACEGGIPALSDGEIAKLMPQVAGWDRFDKKISRTYKFSNFIEAMDFANKITKIAEKENHHPDLHISWGKVTVDLSTHKVDGLSINDFVMASKINAIPPV